MGSNFKYRWFARADIDAFFGVFFDGFSKVLAGVAIMIFGFGMPADIVLGRIVPGLAVATMIGNFWYVYEAYELAKKENRQDVTAQPYGVGAPLVFGWLFLIMGPIFWETGDALLAFQVGVAACFVGGIIEIIGAFIGREIIKYTPRAAILGNLAATTVIWMSLVSMFNVFEKPVIALLPLFIIIMAFIGKVKMPFNLPASLVAITLGTVIAWSTGNMDAAKVSESVANMGFYPPQLAVSDVAIGLKAMGKYLPIVLPMQLMNFLGTLQCVESAAIAGDRYPIRKSMVMDGIGTVIGSLFGNPFPTTVYYGHPSWKEIGARSGYSVLNGIAYAILAFTGLTGFLSAIIPVQVVMPVLLFVGVVMGAQAFNETPKRHAVAILLGFLPVIAQYMETGINAALTAAGTSMAEIGIEAFGKAAFPIQGLLALSQGAFLSSLLIAAIVTYIIDREYMMSAYFCIVASASAFIGLIHAPQIQLGAPGSLPFAIVYACVAGICVILKYKSKPEVEIRLDEAA